ncbi:cytochrome P450 [Bisporella sp. PMI_857]|nr:cytochrome P450 [Bisporella sp. PMI_857]
MAILLGLELQPTEVARALLWGAAISFLTLFTYRLAFHPLAKYPGPLLARLTTLYGAYHAYHGDMHLDLQRLHRKHGTFVRYGPNALSVGSVNGYHDIYGYGKKFRKADSYSIHGPGSLIGTPDKAEHARKKRIFSQGFSDTALREHEPKVIDLVNLFSEKLLEDKVTSDGWTKPKNLSDWCTYLTTDIITKVMFTTTYELLASTKNHQFLVAALTAGRMLGIIHQSALFYKFPLLLALIVPAIGKSLTVMRGHIKDMLKRSLQARENNALKDNLERFRKARDPVTGEVLTEDYIRRSCTLFVGAGSDTSAVTLAATFHYLSCSPEFYVKVASEVRSTFKSLDSIRPGPALNSCVLLRATVNEALRLTPPAAQPLWREAEPGGATVDGQFFPPGVNLGTSLYVLHRTSSFASPNAYNPARWIPLNDSDEEKDRIKNLSRSFAPFSTGSRQCIAKNFAMMEILTTLAIVLYRSDFEAVGTGKDGEDGEFEFKSYFTTHTKGPMLRFREREI